MKKGVKKQMRFLDKKCLKIRPKICLKIYIHDKNYQNRTQKTYAKFLKIS